ncbi:MAG: HEAT repeat domain-containing protein [Coriobacteriia bacterium]|nr:HEAT repeat domain-containing protein [Coriobacteriia bacterium]
MAASERSPAFEHAVRALSTALKTARLYPPASPIPQQSARSASDAIADALRESGHSVLPLVVARDGLTLSGTDSVLGAPDVAELLASHGIAEIALTPEISDRDVTAFLASALKDPQDVKAEGGLAAVLERSGVEGIRVSEVAITVVDRRSVDAGDRPDDFLATMASDAGAISSWLESMSAKDPGALAEGLAALADAAGPDGPAALAGTLARVFGGLSQDAKDALLSAAVRDDGASTLFASALRFIDGEGIAEALAHGSHSANMLALSNTLARLPLAERLGTVLADLKPMLAALGRGPSEIGLMEHMLEARMRPEPEVPLVDREAGYREAALRAEEAASALDGMRHDIATAATTGSERAVRLMLDLLDRQTDFGMYCKTLDGLASTVPALIETRRLDLARAVLQQLSSRESRADLPWPELSSRISEAMARATSARAMEALLHAAMDDRRLAAEAKSLLASATPSASAEFVRAALASRDPEALAAAELVLGKRIVDVAIALAPSAQWFEAGPLAVLLARSGDDPRARAAIEALVSRADAQTRQEVARSLGAVGAPLVLPLLRSLAKDVAPEVRAAAIRALGKTNAPGAASALAELFDELDCDGKDFQFCREIIFALSRSPDPESDAVLKRIADRKALIKRGHFTEVVESARKALEARSRGGVSA